MAEMTKCHCGRPLHYVDLRTQAAIEKMIEKHGEFINVVVKGRTFKVQRHFIALHGLVAKDLPKLGFQEI